MTFAADSVYFEKSTDCVYFEKSTDVCTLKNQLTLCSLKNQLTLSLPPSPPLSLPLSLSLYLSLSVRLCLSVSLFLSVSLSFPACHSVPTSLYLFLCLPTVCLSLCGSLSLCPPCCLSVCLSVSTALCLSAHLSVYVCLCLSVIPSVCLSLCICLFVSSSLSLSLFSLPPPLSLSLSVCLCLSHLRCTRSSRLFSILNGSFFVSLRVWHFNVGKSLFESPYNQWRVCKRSTHCLQDSLLWANQLFRSRIHTRHAPSPDRYARVVFLHKTARSFSSCSLVYQ